MCTKDASSRFQSKQTNISSWSVAYVELNPVRAGLVERLIITRVPVPIGDGIPLFGSLPHDIRLRHVATRHFPSGLVQSEYHVATDRA